MPMKATDLSDQYDDRMVITRAKPTQTPGVGRKYTARDADTSHGYSRDISAKVEAWSKRRVGRSGC